MSRRPLLPHDPQMEIGQVLSQRLPFSGRRCFDVHLKQTFMNPAGQPPRLVDTGRGHL